MSTNKDQPTSQTPDVKTAAISWLTGQSFNNVLLACILCAGLYGLQYLVTTAIPQHLNQIQEGYERIEESHKCERRETREQYESWVNKMIERAGQG